MICDGARVSSNRRATSKPVRPGICTSRNTRSGCSLSIVVSASTPLPAWPTISTPPTWPSRKPSSSRANCSSSTTTVRRSAMSGGHPLDDGHVRNLDLRARALSGRARQLQAVLHAVDGPQPFVDVAEADAVAERAFQPIFTHADPIVADLDDGVAVAPHSLNG